MNDLTSLEEKFDRARSISEKLSRYADVERRYRELETELRELEQDRDIARALGLPVSGTVKIGKLGGRSSTVASPLEPIAKAVEDATPEVGEDEGGSEPKARRWGEIPRSPGGRIQRGFLDRVFPQIAAEKFSREITVTEMRDIVARELDLEDMSRSSIQALVRRAVKAGKMYLVTGSNPEKYLTQELRRARAQIAVDRFDPLQRETDRPEKQGESEV